MKEYIDQIKKDPFGVISNLPLKTLENIVIYANEQYYNTDKPVFSDNIYDLIIDYIRHKDPKNKVLKEIGAKVHGKNKVKLDYHLGSMDKVKPPSKELEKWASKYKPPYVLTDKLDGISALLIYRENGDINLYTRGTSSEGLDITRLLKYLVIPDFEKVKKFSKNNKGEKNMMAFRGELIIRNDVFQQKWSKTFSNPRNTVSGVVNSKKSLNPNLARDIDFILYEVVDPFMEISKNINIMNKIGFKVVYNETVTKISHEFLTEYLRIRKKLSKYDIDGIIVTNDDKHKRCTSGNPKYAFAFKVNLESSKVQTRVIDIEWTISKDGYYNPVVVFEPVIVGGVTIQRATAHNARFISDNNIGPNSIITIIRSGDVIPEVSDVITPTKAKLPEGDWKWSKSKVDIISNVVTDEMKVKNLYFFFSTLNTKSMGERTVEKIFNAGYKTIKDIIEMKKEDILAIDGFKEKSASNMVKNIHEALSNVDLALIMSASNKLGRGMGYERNKMILDKYPNILNNKWKKKEFIEKIKEIDGFDEITATLFASNFSDFKKFYDEIKSHIKLKDRKSKSIKSKLSGKKVVFSGFRDKEFEEKAKDMNIKITTSVSKNTDLVVVDDINSTSSKIEKAKELGLVIITREEFKKLI